MIILTEDLQDKIKLDNSINELIEQAVKLSLKNENIKMDTEISIFFVDDSKIQEINREQRNIDKATDVLTFPMAEFEKGVLNLRVGDINMDDGLLVLGDIVISLERAEEQAKNYGHSLEREVIFLITHGMYHILGYDHLDDKTEKEMMSKQEKILEKLNLRRN